MKPTTFVCGRTAAGALSVAVLMAWTRPAMGIEPRDLFAFAVGPVVVKPSVQLMGQYDDNLFYLPTPRIDDFVFLIRPGVDFRLGSVDTQHRITFGYDFTSRFYVDNTDQNSNDHEFSVSASLNWTKFRAQLDARLQYLTGIFGGYEAFGDGIFIPVGKVDRFFVPISASVNYSLSEKTEIYVRGTARLSDYQSKALILRYYDLVEWKAFLGAAYKFSPKSSVFAEGYYGQYDSQRNSSLQPNLPTADVAGGSIGVRGELTKRLTGSVKVGWETLSDAAGLAEFSEPAAEISLTGKITERISAQIGYARRTGVSPQGTSVSGDPSVRAMLGYVQDYFNGSVRGQFGAAHPWTVTVSGGYGLNDYLSGGVSRSSEFYRVGLDVAYQIKLWMTTGASYEYTSSSYGSGNVSANYGYDDNRVSIFASFGL